MKKPMQSHRNFGFMLQDVRRRFGLRFEQRAREFSLTLPQCRALAMLSRNEGSSQAKLAQLADVEPMTMVRILDHMEKEGLLERRVDPQDRRARCLYLTSNAKPLLDRIWRIADRTRSEAFAGIDRQDRDVFIDVLARIQANLSALLDAPIDKSPVRALEKPAKRGDPARRVEKRK